MSTENPIREKIEGKVFFNKETLKSGEISSVFVVGESLPEVWGNAVLATWEYGTTIPTEYDQPIDPDSRDATLMLTISDPFAEPRIHKAIPIFIVSREA